MILNMYRANLPGKEGLWGKVLVESKNDNAFRGRVLPEPKPEWEPDSVHTFYQYWFSETEEENFFSAVTEIEIEEPLSVGPPYVVWVSERGREPDTYYGSSITPAERKTIEDAVKMCKRTSSYHKTVKYTVQDKATKTDILVVRAGKIVEDYRDELNILE